MVDILTQADPPSTLTSEQLHAALDILTHNETYREAESFKYPYAIKEYGYPFSSTSSTSSASSGSNNPSYAELSSSPLLQLFLTRCLLTVPGVPDLPPDFWHAKFQGIMSKLAEADLSDSYDKGALGTRKTLAAAGCVIHEAITRGLLGGVVKRDAPVDLRKSKYDTTQASELERAWGDCVHELIHGDLADELFDNCAQSEDFETHSPAVKAASDYAILHIASFLHHILVLSSEGQYLLKLTDNVYKMVPFSMVRQTLKISNAATMIHGMMRIFLAKVSVGAVTNWFGLTKAADDGMNLLQRIVSLILSWDSSDFRKVADKVESSKDKPSKEHFAALREYLAMPLEAHHAMRGISMKEQKSIVAVIFDATDPKLTASLTESQHKQCLEWYSAQLSIRDREEITKVLCTQKPDLFTSILRDLVDTYEPFIRSLHGSMDLREHVTSMEKFFDDILETSKPKKVRNANGSASRWRKYSGGKGEDEMRPPSVEDYVALLQRNKHLLYQFCHQFCESRTDVREKFHKWANDTIKNFRNATGSTGTTPQHHQTSSRPGAAGALSDKLQDMFYQLPPETQQSVVASLESHTSYLSKLETLSRQRMQRVLDEYDKRDPKDNDKSKSSRSNSPQNSSGGDTMSGPGVYLMRWELLLDETLITPDTIDGPVRRGKEVKGRKVWGKTGTEAVRDGKDAWDPAALAQEEESVIPEAPDVSVVMDALGESFRRVVNEVIGDVGPLSPPPSSPPPPLSA